MIPWNFAQRIVILLIKIPATILILALWISERHWVRKIIFSYYLSIYNEMLEKRYLWFAAFVLRQSAWYMVMFTCIAWKWLKRWFILTIILLLIEYLLIYYIILLIFFFLLFLFLLFFFLIYLFFIIVFYQILYFFFQVLSF